ncbi:MAG TPA: cytochrome c biogenesis protein CcdA [Humisphaera sp.]|jgi:thiol:disulfide interchange protein DsbD|nr:cytochrome c biogenesis protein CcdA [Humisphaera sp.]
MGYRFAILVVALLGLPAALASGAETRAEISRAVLNYKSLQPGQQAVVGIVVDIKPGFHAQSHTPSSEDYIAFVVKLPAVAPAIVYDPIYPQGETHNYAVGKLNVYTGQVIVYVPVEIPTDAKPGPLSLAGTVRWQICDEDKCYIPETKKFTVETTIAAAGQAVQTQYPEVFKNFDPKTFSRLKKPTTMPAAGSTQTPSAGSSAGGTGSGPSLNFFGFVIGKTSFVMAFIAAFVAGIMFNAVPCVLPVVPLKAMGFYEVSKHDRLKCLAFGAVFSAGLIASFAVLAVVVVVFQYGWGQFYSNVWFNLVIVLILLGFAVGTFGFFSIDVPTSLYSIAPRHDTYLGNFLFGILTAVLSTPCTFGLFFGLLIWASSQPRSIGVALVMTVGAGMAFPYFLLSAFPEVARKLPRSGPWADLIKQEMGFLLLGSAIFFARRFIQPVLGPDAVWWLLFVVAVIAAFYLIGRAIQYSPRVVPRLIAASLAALIVGTSFELTLKLVHQPYTWTPYSQTALTQARGDNRVVVVEFTATWCTNCQYVETHTLHDSQIVKTVKQNNVEMIKADLTSEAAPGWELLRQINAVAAIPFTAVYGPKSSEPIKLEGIYSADELRSAIDRAAKNEISSQKAEGSSQKIVFAF